MHYGLSRKAAALSTLVHTSTARLAPRAAHREFRRSPRVEPEYAGSLLFFALFVHSRDCAYLTLEPRYSGFFAIGRIRAPRNCAAAVGFWGWEGCARAPRESRAAQMGVKRCGQAREELQLRRSCGQARAFEIAPRG